MKSLKLFCAGSLLCVGFLSADGLDVGLGPLNVQIGTDDGYYNDGYYNEGYGYPNNGQYMQQLSGAAVGSPICQAITNRNQVEVIVQTREIVNSKEAKMVTKRVLIEPYGLAVTRDGQPVLSGNVVSEKMIKEVTVKFDEDHFKTEKKDDEKSSSWFSSSKSKNIDLSGVKQVNILQDTHFDSPKDYKGFNDDSLSVICELPPVK